MIELVLKTSFVPSTYIDDTFNQTFKKRIVQSVVYNFLLCAPCEADSWLSFTAHIWRYEDKRWVARDAKPKSPSRLLEEKSPSQWQKPVENTFEERKKIQPSNAIPATRISVLAPPKGHVQVSLFLLIFHILVVNCVPF
jgi:hypothetical protein